MKKARQTHARRKAARPKRSGRKATPARRKAKAARPRRRTGSSSRPGARPKRRAASSSRSATKRRKSKPRQPRLAVVAKKRRLPAPGPIAPAFPQRAEASAKQLVLFEMVRARAMVHGAILGLSAGATNEPLAPGKWSVRETVLHLATRDQARLREMEAALRGISPSWRGVRDPEMAAINAETMEPLRHLDWEESVRLLHRSRQQLMEELEMVPEEPVEVWSKEHPFGWMFQVLSPHDRHHADTIKRWRAERGV